MLVARGTSRGLGRVRTSLERLADGDLTHDTGIDQRDDVGRMAAALDSALGSLRSVMASVAARTALGSTQVAVDELSRMAVDLRGSVARSRY
ncbi:HAMP domain-containing protein [Goekera deserti]|uniref:HAMP domain-containing protein n=1 Tax=Goekera deserti TaxID=2497753 RepID=UPI001F2C1D84|nr:HAMP domain-containing protein [Goekera deserti]